MEKAYPSVDENENEKSWKGKRGAKGGDYNKFAFEHENKGKCLSLKIRTDPLLVQRDLCIVLADHHIPPDSLVFGCRRNEQTRFQNETHDRDMSAVLV